MQRAREEAQALAQRLADSERFGHSVLDGLDVGIVTTDDRGTVTFANGAALRLLQVADDVAGLDVRDVLALTEPPSHLLRDRERRTLTYLLQTPDGDELDVELVLQRGEGSFGRPLGYFCMFRDLREEKQREAERSRFERLAAMGTMVAGFAHEVRNPVAAMRSIAEELGEELAEAGVTVPHVRLMLQMLERVERLVRTSLQFGRPAAPKRSVLRPWIIVARALGELRPELRGFADQISIEHDSALPDVCVDEQQFAQALVILLQNAIEATGSPRRVRVRVRRGRGQDQEPRARKSEPPVPAAVRFEVIDDGPGIAPEIQSRIFDPFFTTKSSGTGLGLSIAQQIVHENGARLEVVSAPGVQTVFAIIVPVESC